MLAGAGLSFLLGWILGTGALTAIFVEVSDLMGTLDKPPAWASWVRIALGALMLAVLAAR